MAAPTRQVRDRKRHGRHYTPPALAEFLAARTAAHLPPGGRVRVLDPACGDGELLLQLARQLLARGTTVELTGFDLDGAAVAAAARRAEAEGIEARWRRGDFLAGARSLAPGSFDAIITNPPYVRTQQLGAATARLLSRRFGLRGRIDLTHPFVAAAPELLSGHGVLGLLCANRFLTTRAGANVRALLSGELSPVELYDLGDTKLFSAAVLPAITIATRSGTPDCRFVAAYETAGAAGDDRTLFEALLGAADGLAAHNGHTYAVRVGTLARQAPAHPPTAVLGARSAIPARADGTARSVDPATRPGGDPWRLAHPATERWLDRVAAHTWRTFGDVARIRVGIKTTADAVFIGDDWDRRAPAPEPELLRPLLTHDHLQPWRITPDESLRVLYPYDTTAERRVTVDLAEFPTAAAYLESHREVLESRHYVLDGGRQWFEIWVPQRPHLWREPKVVFPDISPLPRFALDRSGAVVNGDCYWISLPGLRLPGDADDAAYLLMGVANSALGVRFYDAVCGNRLYSGRRRWITQYVARLPLPDPAGAGAAAIVERVRAVVEDGADPAAAGVDEAVAAAFGVH
ncbi:Eco57I restriction-modification methylase domain-containing protein [Nocardia thailandica]|uniref:Eco57I restriction-modification methylase domain-containing protein n=1 Tax=Nocardia thailandica TaxID=257275 RepID=UPI0005BC4659|nr:methyltransferase domain-containing protein [Nocardia thailandica]